MKLPPGAIITEPGNSANYETGGWRSRKPEVDAAKCTGCGLCSMYCPEPCISKSKPAVVNYRYCKGCGICAAECPFHAITMVEEERT